MDYVEQDITSFSTTSMDNYFGGYDPGSVTTETEMAVRPVGVEQVLTLDDGVINVLQPSYIDPVEPGAVPVPTSEPIPVPDLSETDIPTTVPIVQAGNGGSSGVNWWLLLLLAGGVYMLSKKRKIK